MQRRAAAVYFILFALIGAGAYGFIQVGMSEPTADLEGPTYSQGDEVTVDGRTYTVTSVESEEGEVTAYGGTVELTWFNESKRGSATLENESTVEYEDDQFQVVIPNGSEDTFRLVAGQNVSAILAADPAVEDATVTRDGTEYVVYSENQSIRPLSEYLPPAETVEFAVGDEFEYRAENVTARIDGVSSSGVALSWAAPGNETVSISQGSNATLNGVTYFAHFTGESQVKILPSQERYSDYTAELEDIRYWDERRNGVWGIVILSLLAGVVLLSAAYLPVRG